MVKVQQNRRLTCISLDLELDNQLLIWATDVDGNAISALVDIESDCQVRWRNVISIDKFECVCIGVGPTVWAVGVDGNVYYRNGVDARTHYCGRDWTQVMYSEESKMPFRQDIRFQQVSAGDECVWAIDRNSNLYCRENVSKMLPLGTSWVRVDKRFKYVSVNAKNEVRAAK